jgi:hypothetical protein
LPGSPRTLHELPIAADRQGGLRRPFASEMGANRSSSSE